MVTKCKLRHAKGKFSINFRAKIRMSDSLHLKMFEILNRKIIQHNFHPKFSSRRGDSNFGYTFSNFLRCCLEQTSIGFKGVWGFWGCVGGFGGFGVVGVRGVRVKETDKSNKQNKSKEKGIEFNRRRFHTATKQFFSRKNLAESMSLLKQLHNCLSLIRDSLCASRK